MIEEINRAIIIKHNTFLLITNVNNFFEINATTTTWDEDAFQSEYFIENGILYSLGYFRSTFNPIKKVENITPYLHLLI